MKQVKLSRKSEQKPLAENKTKNLDKNTTNVYNSQPGHFIT